jgi:GntR family transcriptional repressor for pyruvate dehydrogenase complex
MNNLNITKTNQSSEAILVNMKKKTYEIIAEELQRVINSGIFKPGDKLDTIENLAKQYHVSRSTIRESLGQLKAHGLIESKQGEGTYVTKRPLQSLPFLQDLPNSLEFAQLLQVRKIIEVGCIELAATLRTESNLEELERIISHMRDSVGNEQISQIYDVNFHLTIARSTQNPFLKMMIESISTEMSHMIGDSRKAWLYGDESPSLVLFEEHLQMYYAIKEKDSVRAVKVMQSHLNTIETVLNKKTKDK